MVAPTTLPDIKSLLQGNKRYKNKMAAALEGKPPGPNMAPVANNLAPIANKIDTPNEIKGRRERWADAVSGASDVNTPTPLLAGAKALVMGLGGYQQSKADRDMAAAQPAQPNLPPVEQLRALISKAAPPPAEAAPSKPEWVYIQDPRDPSGKRSFKVDLNTDEGRALYDRQMGQIAAWKPGQPPPAEATLQADVQGPPLPRTDQEIIDYERQNNMPSSDETGRMLRPVAPPEPAPSYAPMNYMGEPDTRGFMAASADGAPPEQQVAEVVAPPVATNGPVAKPQWVYIRDPRDVSGKTKFKVDLNTDEGRALYDRQMAEIAGYKPEKPGQAEEQPADPMKLSEQTALRKETMSLPPVENYMKSIDQYKGMMASAQNPTPPGDIGMIIALAKIWDPPSVVREGERDVIRNTGNLPMQLESLWKKQIEGTGELTEEQRAWLLQSAQQKLEAYRGTAEELYSQYEDRFAGQADREDIINELPPAGYKQGASSQYQGDQNMMTSQDPRFARKLPTEQWRRQQPAVAAPAPEGVDPAIWNAMTPEERALWQN
jgi:hypothetical protein